MTSEVVAGPNEADDSAVADRIVQAATQCYIHFGLARTKVQEIARVAGVSRATVYRYFSGPGAVRLAVMARLSADLLARVEARTSADDGLDSFISNAFEILADFNREMRFAEHLTDPRERISSVMFDEQLETGRFARRLFGAKLREAKANGYLATDITEEDALNLLIIGIEAVGGLSQSHIQDRPPKQVGQWLARMICGGIQAR